MIEGFDIATLALTSVLLGVLLGVGLLTFAPVHPAFHGFKQLGCSYLLLAISFLLIGMHNYLNDWLTIVLGYATLLLSFTLLGCGLFNFFKISQKKLISLSLLLQITLISSLSYLTFIDNNPYWRQIMVSFIVSCLLIYVVANLKKTNDNHHSFLYIIRSALLFCGLCFFFSALWQVSRISQINSTDNAFIQALSLIILQCLNIIICFSMSRSASDRLAQSLAEQATIDPLTQTFNRRALQEFAEKALAQAKRINTNIVIIIMDIDNFKKVNDEYGHQAGDQVLIEFSRRLRDNLREYDILARFGGEEFLLLLPNTELESALTISEKLRDTIASPVFLIKENTHVTITASFGVAIGKGESLDWKQMISQADIALYQAKNEGKNRVKIHCGDIIPLGQTQSHS